MTVLSGCCPIPEINARLSLQDVIADIARSVVLWRPVMNLRLFFIVRTPRELDIPGDGRAISANEPITARNKEAAANGVADGDPKQVLSGAHVRQTIRMLGKKRQRKYRHVRHRVLKAARDKSKKAPEDDEDFRGVIRGPRG